MQAYHCVRPASQGPRRRQFAFSGRLFARYAASPWLAPASRNLTNRRFAFVAEIGEGGLQASYFCRAPARVGAMLLHISRARFRARGGRRQQILTRWREVAEVLLEAAREAAPTGFTPAQSFLPSAAHALTAPCAMVLDPNSNNAALMVNACFNMVCSYPLTVSSLRGKKIAEAALSFHGHSDNRCATRQRRRAPTFRLAIHGDMDRSHAAAGEEVRRARRLRSSAALPHR